MKQIEVKPVLPQDANIKSSNKTESEAKIEKNSLKNLKSIKRVKMNPKISVIQDSPVKIEVEENSLTIELKVDKKRVKLINNS